MTNPTESYVLCQRAVTFLDEWLFYGLLVYLYINDYSIIWAVAPIGTAMIVYSYIRLWRLEDKMLRDTTTS